MSNIDQLKSQIQEKLIESGEYDRISALLKQKLAENGWFDNIKKLANDEINNQQDPNFEKLTSILEPRALCTYLTFLDRFCY